MSSDLFSYHIPDEIKKHFSDDFLSAVGENCAAELGFDPLMQEEDGDSPALFFCTGTYAWTTALLSVCQQFDLQWIYDYWEQLPWYHSDIFDGELASAIIQCLEKGEQ